MTFDQCTYESERGKYLFMEKIKLRVVRQFIWYVCIINWYDLDQVKQKRLIKIDSSGLPKESKVGSYKKNRPNNKGQFGIPFCIKKKFLSYDNILGF